MNTKELHTFFPEFTEELLLQYSKLAEWYVNWNEKINVISRKDIEHIVEHHFLHALAVTKFIDLEGASNVLDVGTGGGIPGIPLAILFPAVEFSLLDSRNKKILVAESIAREMGLDNVRTVHGRMEDHTKKYNIIMGRAVTEFRAFRKLVLKNLEKSPSSRIIYWTGGDMEPYDRSKKNRIYHIHDQINTDHYLGKYIIEHRAF